MPGVDSWGKLVLYPTALRSCSRQTRVTLPWRDPLLRGALGSHLKGRLARADDPERLLQVHELVDKACSARNKASDNRLLKNPQRKQSEEDRAIPLLGAAAGWQVRMC